MPEGPPKPASARDRTIHEDLREGVEVAGVGMDILEVLQRITKFDKVLDRLPTAARAMIFAKALLAVVGTASAEAPDPGSFSNALNTAARIYTATQVERGKEAGEANAQEIEQQFQSFLDEIQPYVRETRELFGPAPTAMELRALRFAFGNVFKPFDNVIAEKNFTKAQEYDARLAAVLGAPASIDDVLADEFSTLYGPLRAEREERFSGAQTPTQLDDLKPDGTPTQQGVGLERFYGKISPEKAQFITALFKIIRSEHFSMLWRDVIKDKGQLIALEVLVYAKFATPKEIAWAKEVARLEQMLGLVHPEIAKSTLS